MAFNKKKLLKALHLDFLAMAVIACYFYSRPVLPKLIHIKKLFPSTNFCEKPLKCLNVWGNPSWQKRSKRPGLSCWESSIFD